MTDKNTLLYPSRVYDGKKFIANVNREQSSEKLTTLAIKDTNEVVGFPENTSVFEMENAIKSDRYGSIETYKPSFYDRVIRDPLSNLGMSSFQPRFITDVKPTPERAFVTSFAESATAGIFKADFSECEKAAYPGQAFAGQLAGALAGLKGIEGMLGALKLPGFAAKASEILTKGLQEGKAKDVATTAAEAAISGGAVGGVFRGVEETSTQIRDSSHPELTKIGTAVLHDTLWWGAIGGTVAPMAKATGVAASAGLGYAMAKADGAPEPDALLNGAILGGFHLVTKRGDEPQVRQYVKDNLERSIGDYVKTHNPLVAEPVAKQTAREYIMLKAEEAAKSFQEKADEGFPLPSPQGVQAVEEVLKSQEATQKMVENIHNDLFDLEPQKEKAKEEKDVSREISKLPKTTEQAYIYGDTIKDKPDEIASLKKQKTEIESQLAQLQKIETTTDAQDQEMFDLAFQKQMINETLEVAEGSAAPAKQPGIQKALENNRRKLAGKPPLTEQEVMDIYEKKPKDEEILSLGKEKEIAPTFYSKLEKTITDKMQSATTPEQIKGILNSSGVKKEEMDWLGVDDFLEGKAKVTKEELLDFVRSNQVKIKEVEKGEEDLGMVEAWWNDEGGANEPEPFSELSGWDRRAAIERYRDEVVPYEESATKFSQHTLPGGENYREMLLTLPEKIPAELPEGYSWHKSQDGWAAVNKGGAIITKGYPTKEEVLKHFKDGKEGNFQSSHFDEPNILAHIRFNDRTGPNGEKILFVEEIQSDWHQKGRKQGYNIKVTDEQRNRLKELQNIPFGQRTDAMQNELDKLTNIVHTTTPNGIPDAPFKKTWYELSLKRMLRYAAENNYDKLAWTSGEIQADRYDLSKHVDEIEVPKKTDGSYMIFGRKNSQNLITEDIKSLDKLEDYIGKDAANKVIEQYKNDPSLQTVRLKGQDLKVGGEGMKGFYDQMVPSFLNKYGKKWGASVGETELNILAKNELVNIPRAKEKVPSIDITPQMKESVLTEGQPIFSRGSRPKENPTVSQTPEELKRAIEQLNKFGQMQAILRRTGGVKNKAAVGQFIPPGGKTPVAKTGEVRLREEYVKSDFNYMSVLAHELGHSLEFNLLGNINKETFKVFKDDIDIYHQDLKKIEQELLAVTYDLEGKEKVDAKPGYYKRPTELLARFLEKMFTSPDNLKELAPTATRFFEENATRHPIIKEFLDAVKGNIDRGQMKYLPLRDLKETYQKVLGKEAGTRAYHDEVINQALVERGKIEIEKLINEKFKDIKDKPELLFRSAESIKRTVNDTPEFGTRDFAKPTTPEEEMRLVQLGYTQVGDAIVDGKKVPILAKDRYTPEQGKEIFDKLSPEGQRLIKDFTATRDEARDFFNRELIKDAYKIEGNIEGWVHHYFEDKNIAGVAKGKRIRERKGGASFKREGVAGFTEDLQKAMHKMLVEHETVKVHNDFIERWFARVSKPIVGDTPDAGWIEVEGNLKKGIGTSQEKKMVVIKDGEVFIPKQPRYQIPQEIYSRYQLFKGLVTEASTAKQIVADLNRYWRMNILFHPGSSGTNFISGGIQYTDKILTDFYRELLTGDVAFKQTKLNISSILNAFTPKGWAEAPDWTYGGDMSNFYGQFIEQKGVLGKSIDAYGDKVLKLYGGVERYWKKVIGLSEGVRDLKSLGTMTKEGLRLPTDEEKEILASLNDATDLYAYNYNNIPEWLQQYHQGVLGKAIKPFATYPYKYFKQVTGDVATVFDRTLPWQDRVAKLMALTTMFGFFTYLTKQQRQRQETPEGTPDTPAYFSPRGKMFVGKDQDGKEIFRRMAKYPFINLTEAGDAFIGGRWKEGVDALSDQIGSIGPIGQVGLLALGYKSEYQQYDSVPVILGNSINTFLPGYRILNDISRALDPFQRKQQTFGQTFTKLIPTTDADLQNKLHGEIRTAKVPTRPGGHTTTDEAIENYKQDVLLGLLTGIYQTRIDPKEAKAFQGRQEKNAKRKEKKDIKDDKKLKRIEKKARQNL